MKCAKCGYNLEKKFQKNKYFFCEVCFVFSPDDSENLQKYIAEKINSSELESFRKYLPLKKGKKQNMIKKAINGNLMSRAPFGYKIQDGNLIPSENSIEVEEIFEEFLTEEISLRSLARKRNLSVNGLKKILKNFTYLGKIKFNKQIYEGKHPSLISASLFNKVQDKLEKKGIK